MKSILATAVLALSCTVAFPALAGASHAGAGGPPRDFAVGGGFTGSESNDPFGAQHVGFAAFGGPTTPAGAGDSVTGHFRAGGEFLDPPDGNDEVGEFQQEGPVTCLVVSGNSARLVYPIKQGRPEANEVNEVLISLEDNGRPRGGRGVDRIGFSVLPDETPNEDPPTEQDDECALPLPPPMSTLTRGDFNIHDAQP
jgi:hypothetical protein